MPRKMTMNEGFFPETAKYFELYRRFEGITHMKDVTHLKTVGFKMNYFFSRHDLEPGRLGYIAKKLKYIDLDLDDIDLDLYRDLDEWDFNRERPSGQRIGVFRHCHTVTTVVLRNLKNVKDIEGLFYFPDPDTSHLNITKEGWEETSLKDIICSDEMIEKFKAFCPDTFVTPPGYLGPQIRLHSLETWETQEKNYVNSFPRLQPPVVPGAAAITLEEATTRAQDAIGNIPHLLNNLSLSYACDPQRSRESKNPLYLAERLYQHLQVEPIAQEIDAYCQQDPGADRIKYIKISRLKYLAHELRRCSNCARPLAKMLLSDRNFTCSYVSWSKAKILANKVRCIPEYEELKQACCLTRPAATAKRSYRWW